MVSCSFKYKLYDAVAVADSENIPSRSRNDFIVGRLFSIFHEVFVMFFGPTRFPALSAQNFTISKSFDRFEFTKCPQISH